MATYDVKITHWVEVEAKDQFEAREIAYEHLSNGNYNDSFEGFAVIDSAERRDPDA